MFTGLITAVGALRRSAKVSSGAHLTIAAPFAAELDAGESVSVNGACLTVVSFDAVSFRADAVTTTLSRTTLGDLRPGSGVNLERALTVGDRLGGHFVAGHVDATARILSVAPSDAGRLVTIEGVNEVARYVVPRGSIAVDGISLTIASVEREAFVVSLIPETLERTTSSSWKTGDVVNLEADLLAKHIDALLEGSAGDGKRNGLTRERLETLGFLKRNHR